MSWPHSRRQSRGGTMSQLLLLTLVVGALNTPEAACGRSLSTTDHEDLLPPEYNHAQKQADDGSGTRGNTSTTAVEDPAWLHVARLVARLLDDCSRRVADVKAADVSSAMRLCLKIRALKSLDKVLRQDVISLGQGMELLRFNYSTTSHVSPSIRPEKVLREDVQQLVVERLSDLLDTHVLRFSAADHDDDQPAKEVVHQSGKGRIRRRHYRHMFPLMVVGFMTMASFLVPLGFQFMAMLGGKALLLSKIALMMSTFQGIKKVTSAGYNYGFYHVPPPADLYHSHAAHHPEAWRRTAVVPEAGKSYSPHIDNTEDVSAAQLQAYQQLLSVLPMQTPAGQTDGYQGSMAQPLPISNNQHVLAVIPYLQNNS